MRDGWKMPEKISCEKMRQKIRTGKTAQKNRSFFRSAENQPDNGNRNTATNTEDRMEATQAAHA